MDDKRTGFYIVEQGTNIHKTLLGRDVSTPEICDTAEIAQNRIDENTKYRKQNNIRQLCTWVPISIAEYNKKYVGDN